MKILIVGAGKVGSSLAAELIRENHDLVLIDTDADVLKRMQDTLDVAVVVGNGTLLEIQREAGVTDSDILIATTNSDEMNLFCCMIAKELGCKHTVARVRNPEYDNQTEFFRRRLGISLIINPEKNAAREISRQIHLPSSIRRESFSADRFSLIELKLPENSILEGQSLMRFAELTGCNALVCTVERNEQIIIPNGSFILKGGDELTVTSSSGELRKLLEKLGYTTRRVKRVMIIGGGRLTVYLTAFLLAAHIDVTIVDKDESRCRLLAESFPKADIIHGDGTDQMLLLDEGIERTDAVVTLTGIDEENLLISLFANSVKVPKTVTKINRAEYAEVLEHVGIQSMVSPKILTADVIMRYVRAVSAIGTGSIHSAEHTGALESMYRIMDGKAEALGFTVPAEGSYIGVPLSKLRLKRSLIIAGIVHAGQVIIPKGSDCMQQGDTVIVITSGQSIASLSEVLA